MRFTQLLGFLQAGLAIASPLASSARPQALTARAGQTYFNIGQNYANELASFESSVKKAAGVSVYGNIYDGTLNSDSQDLLATYAGGNGNRYGGFELLL